MWPRAKQHFRPGACGGSGAPDRAGGLRPLWARERRSSEAKVGAGRAEPRRPRSARQLPPPERGVAWPRRPPASDPRPRGAGRIAAWRGFAGTRFPPHRGAARTALEEAPSGGPGAEPWAGRRPRRGGLTASREPAPRPGSQRPWRRSERAPAQVGVVRLTPRRPGLFGDFPPGGSGSLGTRSGRPGLGPTAPGADSAAWPPVGGVRCCEGVWPARPSQAGEGAFPPFPAEQEPPL